jgi:sulfate transport system substrate-binding protein
MVLGALTLVVAGLLLAPACGGGRTGQSSSGAAAGEQGAQPGGKELPSAKLSLVAYSTPKEAYERLIKAFNETPEGRNTTLRQSYGASGDQSRAVESGLTADIVSFSLEPDMTRLVKANLVPQDWNQGPQRGMVTDSVVVFVVRKGNPQQVRTWQDLARPGVEVLTPNPFTSGGARWNVMAGYGAASNGGRDDRKGVEYLHMLFRNVKVQDETARKSLQTFTTGKGDVMLAYENEAIFAQRAGQPIDYVVPDQTILIENPVALTTAGRSKPQAQAFLSFLLSPKGQEIFAASGYRPVLPGVSGANRFPRPSGLFTIADLGGWPKVATTFFDPGKGIMAEVESSIGVSVGH